LDEELQARILESRFEQLSSLPGTESLREGIAQFLKQFGHLSDSGNDFSHQPWRENPDLVLRMVVTHTPHKGSAVDRVRYQDLELPPLRRPLFKSVYGRARRFRWYREAVSSLYTLGYGLFRDYYLALGEHFACRGIIDRKDDVFFLYKEEVRDIVESGSSPADYRELIVQRKDEIEAVRDVAPPDMIFGDQAPPLEPEQGQGLKGIATSQGRYTGLARVLQGIQDMGKVQEGDVLVIPYSDVGWTPLFARAGAVVAESGGILSHSSIIAREYGIPAVVSVPGACQLEDGACVTVDGYRGEIVVHEPTEG
jgi:pyruvate,water dikinase